MGFENRVGRDYATVVGGLDNTAIGYASTAMGQHSIASGEASTAMGRDTKASGEWATAFGLQTHAIGSGSTAGGVLSQASGYASVALGYNAHSTFDGSFVWADHTDGPFASSNGNQFLIRASGGVAIGTNNPAGVALRVAGTVRADQIDAGQILGSPAYLQFAETTPKGVAAGENVITGANSRNFNTTPFNTHNLAASLNNGDITLPAGTYQCRISAPAYRVDGHQTRLKIVNGAVLLYGTSEYSDNTLSPGVQSRSEITGQFTLASTSTIRVEHATKTVKTVNGLGLPATAFWTDGNPVEVYTVAEFWKIR